MRELRGVNRGALEIQQQLRAVESERGTHKVAIDEVADDGPISHYVHPAGIEAAPVREFTREV